MIAPNLAIVLQIPTAVFLILVGYSCAVYMKVTLNAAEAPIFAPRARIAKPAIEYYQLSKPETLSWKKLVSS